MRQHSILDDLGEEVTGIVAPVSCCMALTVALVQALNPEGVSGGSGVAIASAYYKEKADDPTSTKLTGSVINALIFVAIVGLMTCVLVVLFKYGYTRLIYGYLGLSGLSIFSLLFGIILLQLLHTFQLHVDAVTFCVGLYNFAVVGVLSLFYWPAPIAVKQGYLVITGVVVAYVFTFIPEWTTWTLLIAMALYDICAVLTPNGPLKVLVEIAQERQQDIPALVYEARPVGRARPGAARPARPDAGLLHTQAEADFPSPQQPPAGAGPATAGTGAAAAGAAPASHRPAGTAPGAAVDSPGIVSLGASGQPPQQAATALLGRVPEQPSTSGAAGSSQQQGQTGRQHLLEAEQVSPGREQADRRGSGRQPSEGSGYSEEDEYGLPDAIKLGLGDFIFYSVLVGRAAMYSIFTAVASYLAIVAGLGATLLLLALHHRALPALPISIALGVAFYFLARLCLEPFALNLSLNLLYV